MLQQSYTVFHHTYKGFTLIEMMLALAIGSILLASIYTFYIGQQKVYAIRELVAEMQQNARIGMALMAREIRMAGYNPAGIPGVGIIEAGPHVIRVTMDLNDDGVIAGDEDITYSLYDSGRDGDLDLGRQPGGGRNDPVAENIASLDFVYTLADGSTTSTPAAPGQIRMVQVFLSAHTTKPDQAYPSNGGYRTYTLQSSITPRNLCLLAGC
jgi:type IV pilus assembly protein PilW